ncbi:DUF427 domain-containing protein [Mesorhizobium sp. M1A.F.Ca.IN.020.06.1.1]|uniref:DUF427 domain-containing protein n=1 Tax=unclassified Mesorhizobium TaxID=325217 RepID=UPI000BAEE3F8|nr:MULTISPECIES: DUF427 domain-containing protein [unclassified Mesorhizobium]PBB35298.1 hypothetical protein CK214_05040 [Mesorhizobium sp. WSM3882]RUV06867.1 DUF427 domain-containing protein [Mesorhizobium sp. M1A.F.Ca.IN.020.03.2.1]RUV89418.1 DUF427 domain-containing protein [Mesorhizobium sp. M1A.F.Ca.IN.020.32.1.1]RUW12499.1 DUF427 domain-containing protein [Mesorhizobium sp. M1A.F.Ca.IN.022.05.2.1]RUW36876.1 DUF427 domain-containing protein [Mesorhizobium sp. M1A.F.Ca.IN.020.06.1.1]
MDKRANPAPGFQRNPDKVITIEPYRGAVTVSAGDVVIARSTRARLLSEPPYPAVFYIPFDDIDLSKLARTEHSTHCPYKGNASYWSVLPAGDSGRDAMWAYEQPFDEVVEIRDHGAFYTGKVTVETKPE